MHLHKTALGFISIAGLWLGASLALADDVAPAGHPGGPGGGSEWCKENPGKCEEARAKHEAFCKENPEKCEQWNQKRAEREAYCKDNPQKCAEQREQFKQHRAEMKAKCEADPAKCEEMKQARRERFMKRHGNGSEPSEHGADAHPGGPPSAPPAQP